MLISLQEDTNNQSNPITADIIENLLAVTEPIVEIARQNPIEEIDNMITNELPVLIYFENYGILNSSIWLSRFIEDLENDPNASQVRTINAMFKHTRLDPYELLLLGKEDNYEVPKEEQAIKLEERAIKLNSASTDISNRFSEWWSQRRHKFRYQADGDYFRIWVADDVRPNIDIELEARSKGFQWFFFFLPCFSCRIRRISQKCHLTFGRTRFTLTPYGSTGVDHLFRKTL